MEHPNILFPFLLTLFAGLSTGIGSAIAFFAKTTNTRFLSVALGVSAGVMIYVSFVEILPESNNYLIKGLGEPLGEWIAIVSFFGGMLITGLIDRMVPSYENPHEFHKVEDMDDGMKRKKLMRMGLFSAFAITLHNFPEGIATFAAGVEDASLGIAIAFAVAIHNIPEGIAVSVPIYHATGSKKKAFMFSFLSGLAEPLGALLAFSVLMPFMNSIVFGVLFASVAGIMIYIAIDELLPAAREYGKPHYAIYGLIIGMVIMAVSLLILH
jgi:zinc transporter, ZIP family